MDAGDSISSENASWSFQGIPISDFDEHISKSVPGYIDSHNIGLWLSDFFVKDDSCIYDLGSSSGAFLNKLQLRHSSKNCSFNGIESVESMFMQSEKLYPNISFHNCDLLTYDFLKSDFITSYYTIQFVPPRVRQRLIDSIYNSLEWGGAFLMFEKVRAPDARFHEYISQMYVEYKLNQGYTPENIIAKSRSLKGVLEPFSSLGNRGLLERAGFVDICTVYKNLCFEGVLAIK